MSTSIGALVRRSLPALVAFGTLTTLAGQALGQETGTRDQAVDAPRSKTEMNAQKEELRQRNRGTMHPGEALTLVGNEQDGNDIRSRTPALAKSDHVATPVNPDANYQRKLSLYADGAQFQTAVPTLAEPNSARRATPAATKAGPQDASATDGSSWTWVLGLFVSALAGWWGYRRFASRA